MSEATVTGLKGTTGMKVLAVLITCTLAALVATIISLSLVVMDNAQRLDQLAPACTVMKALDPLIQNAYITTEKALADGTYARLVEKGVISRAQFESVGMTMQKYRSAHAVLQTLNCIKIGK